MKIEKEIIFAAKINEVQALLDKSGIRDKGSFYEIEEPSKAASIKHGAKKGATPTTEARHQRDENSAENMITTEYDLAEFGNRTLLKITVHGWDKFTPEKAKVEMPRAALLLERKLSQIKKTLEKQTHA